MVGAAHLMAATDHFDSSSGGHRAIWYLIVLAVGAVAELIALKAPAVGSGLSKHLDDHKMTIASGFALTIVLYVLLEVIF
jgi:hypothetical protein